MTPRARHLIRQLQLQPHPEGGWYREVFRSSSHVQTKEGRRDALTSIYFLLAEDDVSRWHSVRSDEVWHYIEGAPLALHIADTDFRRVKTHSLGPVRGGKQRPLAVVSAGAWQAAETTGAHTLVACDVGPGFDFADFRMLRETPNTTGRPGRKWLRFV